MKKWVGVEVYGLIVQDVHVFNSEQEAEDWFKKYTGYDYPQNADEWEAIYEKPYFEHDYDQTKIFEVEVV